VSATQFAAPVGTYQDWVQTQIDQQQATKKQLQDAKAALKVQADELDARIAECNAIIAGLKAQQ